MNSFIEKKNEVSVGLFELITGIRIVLSEQEIRKIVDKALKNGEEKMKNEKRYIEIAKKIYPQLQSYRSPEFMQILFKLIIMYGMEHHWFPEVIDHIKDEADEFFDILYDVFPYEEDKDEHK